MLRAYQRAATIEEIIKFRIGAEVALGEWLASTYAAQADTPPDGRPAKAATKRSAPDQIGKGNRRHISVTENPPAPTKKRGPQRPLVKRRTASIHDDEQEEKLTCFSGSRNDSPGSERFDDSDKFLQLLGKSRRKTFTHLLNPQSYINMTGRLYGALG